MFHRNWFHYYMYLWLCTELQVLSKTASRLWFFAYKKIQERYSTRRTDLQRHIRSSITQHGSDNFCSGISGNLPKIATSNVIFSRTADRIAAKFCMTIQKIKPNDIFQNCVHSTSTLSLLSPLASQFSTWESHFWLFPVEKENEFSFSITWPLCSYKTIYKNPEHKTHIESRDIDENNIVPWLGEMFVTLH